MSGSQEVVPTVGELHTGSTKAGYMEAKKYGPSIREPGKPCGSAVVPVEL